jgi:succinate-acetate transporter protein
MAEQVNGSSPARVFLQPVAAPSILGLFGFAAATFMVAAHVVGWYGNQNTFVLLAPFAAAFGGIGQVIAAVWGYKARDGIATAMHGAWGLFWIAFGALWLLIGTGALPPLARAGEVAYGYWFAMLAAVTLVGALAAMREQVALSAVLHALWVGAALLAVGLMTGAAFWGVIGGYVLLLSALIAWYTAGALMLEGVGAPVLPVGKTRKAEETPEVDVGAGEPGVKHGQ